MAVRSQRPSSRRRPGASEGGAAGSGAAAEGDGIGWLYHFALAAQSAPYHPMPSEDIIVKPRDVMPETARTLPAEYYVDRTFYEREMERFFRGMWICAG